MTAPWNGLIPLMVILLKVTALLLVAFGVTLAMRRASAGARHLVWLLTVGALLLVPPLTAWGPLPVPMLPELPRTPAPEVTGGGLASEAAPVREGALRGPVRVDSHSAPAASLSGNLAAASLWTWLVASWMLVGLVLLARLAYGAWSVRRIVRRARRLDQPGWQTPLYEIADRLGIEDAPELLQSDQIKMPFASGMLQPTIVLPADSESWSAERRSAVLVHELGHVRRRDLVGHTLSRVACILYWFHPLVWIAARRLRDESERACDDLALVFGARPSDYASHLLDIVSAVRNHRTPAVALAMAHRAEFEGRMLAILNPELERRGPGRLTSAWLVASGAVLVALLGAAAPVHRVAATEQAAIAADTSGRIVLPPGSATPKQPVSARAEPRNAAPEATRPASAVLKDEVGDDRADALAHALRTDSSARVRRVAAWGLQRYAELEVGLKALTAALASDSDADVREMAAWSLASADGNPEATAALLKAIRQERDPSVRSTSVWAIGSLGDLSAVETLTGILGDADARARELAAWGIGTAGPDRAPAALVKALADQDRGVRLSVAWALYCIRDPQTAAALDAAFRRESDPDVRRGLLRAVSVLGDQAVETLQGLVSSPDPELREMAVTALAGGSVGGPWPWPRPRPRPFP